jgi:hypothetical protein
MQPPLAPCQFGKKPLLSWMIEYWLFDDNDDTIVHRMLKWFNVFEAEWKSIHYVIGIET